MCKEVKTKVLYSSTSSGYGLNEAPNVETQPDDCLNPYSYPKIGKNYVDVYRPLWTYNYISIFNVFGERAPRKVSMLL